MQSVNYDRVQHYFFVDLCYSPIWNVPEIALCTSRRSLGPQIVGSSGKRLNTISHNSAPIVDYAHITWVQNKGAVPAIWTIHTDNVHNIQATQRKENSRIFTNINVSVLRDDPISYASFGLLL